MPRSSTTGSGSISQAPANPVSLKRMPASDDPDVGNGHDELPATRAILGLLRGDLVQEIPRQEKKVVGPVRQQVSRRKNSQVRPGSEPPLLLRAAIDHVFQLRSAYSEVVE